MIVGGYLSFVTYASAAINRRWFLFVCSLVLWCASAAGDYCCWAQRAVPVLVRSFVRLFVCSFVPKEPRMAPPSSLPSLHLTQSFLQRDPLRHVVLQKLLRAHAAVADVRYTAVDGHPAALILIPTTASAWDTANYPATDTIALLAADHAIAADRLLAELPVARYVFKVAGALERDAVLRRIPAQRTTAFISYTTGPNTHPIRYANVVVTDVPNRQVLAIFAEHGHAPDSLWQACHSGEGLVFTATVDGDSVIAAACFVMAIGDGIWEIGGLFTQPDYRRRGLAIALVETALHELAQRGVLARYQVHERNHASIRLAEAVGLRQFVVVEHWVGSYSSIV
jgi:GNAT superfamily N-acetyltransferase